MRQEIIRRIAVIPSVERAVLYGSRARGDQHKRSDIDIALFGEQVTDEEVSRLRDRLDRSPIVFPIDITAVALLRAESRLRDEIERDAVTLYERAA